MEMENDDEKNEGQERMSMKNYRAQLTGVFGDPVDDNPSGVVEEAGYEAMGLNYRYLTIRVKPDDLEIAMQSVRAFGMRGINLTMPHKIHVIPFLDELSQSASIIGAVNTVINENGKLIGENTDGKGFTLALSDDGVKLENTVVTILGAGGAARAIAVECALSGAKKVLIVNRTKERGQILSDLINEKTRADSAYLPWRKEMEVPEETDILINGTSIGLKPEDHRRPDINYGSISPHMHVCDVVFNPSYTLFLKAASDHGAKVHNGLGMLVRQAAINFTLWTGKEAPLDVMAKALKNEFSR